MKTLNLKYSAHALKPQTPLWRVKTKAVLAVLTLLAVLLGISTATAATVTTDQSDYAPGSTATITGSGFQAGEQVQLQVLRTDINENSGPEHQPWQVTADDNGNFTTTWYVTPDEAGATLQLTATGLSSGLTAQTTFTDNKNLTIAFSGTGSGTVIDKTNSATINCSWNGTTISGTFKGAYPNSELVMLTATPNAGSAIGGWVIASGSATIISGGGAGQTNCEISLNNSSSTLTVTLNPAASIALTSGNNQSAQVTAALSSPFVVIVKDGSGNPVAGTTITFATASTPSGATGQSLSTTTTTSGADGQASSTLTLGTRSGTYTVTATSTGLSGSPVTFTATGMAGTVSASQSTLSASPTSVTADGSTTSTITVTLKDANGNPVSGKTVTLASSRGVTDTISAASGSSSSLGAVTFTVKSTATGAAVFTAADTTDGTTLSQTATVTFTASSITALTSSSNPALPGTAVTFTATVTPVPPSIGTPTGTVQFKTNGAVFGTPVTLNGSALVLITNSILPHGSNTITAEYSGNTYFLASTGRVSQVIDTPPVAGLQYLTTVLNTTLHVSATTLAGLNYDADGDVLTITAVSSVSTNGGTITLSGGNVNYTPATSYVGADQFTYTISDGYPGGTATCTNKVTVTLGKATSVFAVPTSSASGTVNLRGYGIPGHQYDIQRSGTISFSSFTVLATVTAAASGVILYTDNSAPNPSYYRFAVH